jgi:hypothetical protein
MMYDFTSYALFKKAKLKKRSYLLNGNALYNDLGVAVAVNGFGPYTAT